jgi:hypothetical protein
VKLAGFAAILGPMAWDKPLGYYSGLISLLNCGILGRLRGWFLGSGAACGDSWQGRKPASGQFWASWGPLAKPLGRQIQADWRYSSLRSTVKYGSLAASTDFPIHHLGLSAPASAAPSTEDAAATTQTLHSATRPCSARSIPGCNTASASTASASTADRFSSGG